MTIPSRHLWKHFAVPALEGTDLVMEFRGGYGFHYMPDRPNPDLQHLLRSEYHQQAPENLGTSAAPLAPDGNRIMNGLAFISE